MQGTVRAFDESKKFKKGKYGLMKQQKQTSVELSQEELQEVTGGGQFGPGWAGHGPETSLTVGGVTMEQNGQFTKAGVAWNRNFGQYLQKQH